MKAGTWKRTKMKKKRKKVRKKNLGRKVAALDVDVVDVEGMQHLSLLLEQGVSHGTESQAHSGAGKQLGSGKKSGGGRSDEARSSERWKKGRKEQVNDGIDAQRHGEKHIEEST